MLPTFMQKPFDVQYFQHIKRLFGTSLISYWPMDEAAWASTVTDYSGQANDGTPSNVTFGQAGIGDGRTSGSFNGNNSYVDVYSAAFNADFNPALFTVMCWAKVANAAVWTDAVDLYVFRFGANINNMVDISVWGVTEKISANYYAGGVVVASPAAEYETTTTDWFHVAVTVSVAADEVKFYFNGALTEAAATGLGTWSGALASGWCNIGNHQILNDAWKGNIAHLVVLNKATTLAEIAEAARVV